MIRMFSLWLIVCFLVLVEQSFHVCILLLVVGTWIVLVACSRRREPLNNNLVCSTPEVIELEEEPEEDENPAPTTNEKEVAPVKGKGKGKRAVSIQVSTRSLTKHWFSKLPLRPSPLWEVHPQVLVPLPLTILPLLPIAVSPSPPCLARGRPSRRIHLPLLRTCRHLFL